MKLCDPHKKYPKAVVDKYKNVIRAERMSEVGLEALNKYIILYKDDLLSQCTDPKAKKFITAVAADSTIIGRILDGDAEIDEQDNSDVIDEAGNNILEATGTYATLERANRQRIARNIRFRIAGGVTAASIAAAITAFVKYGGLKVVSSALLNAAAKISATKGGGWKVALLKLAIGVTAVCSAIWIVNFKKDRGVKAMTSVGVCLFGDDFSIRSYHPTVSLNDPTLGRRGFIISLNDATLGRRGLLRFPYGLLFPGNYSALHLTLIHDNILLKAFNSDHFDELKAYKICQRIIQFGAATCQLVHEMVDIQRRTYCQYKDVDNWALLWDQVQYDKKNGKSTLFMKIAKEFDRVGRDNIYTALSDFIQAANAHLANPDIDRLQMDKLLRSVCAELYWAGCVRSFIHIYYMQNYFTDPNMELPSHEGVNTFNRDLLSMISYLEQFIESSSGEVLSNLDTLSFCHEAGVYNRSYDDYDVVDIYKKQIENLTSLVNGKYKYLVRREDLVMYWEKSHETLSL